MTSDGKMQVIGIVPDQDAGNINTRTCNVTLPIPNASVFAYAEANYSELFPGIAASGQYQQYNYRYYSANGNYLAIGDDNVIYLYGPINGYAFPPLYVGSVESFRNFITGWEDTLSP
jgi:hypothetical protein